MYAARRFLFFPRRGGRGRPRVDGRNKTFLWLGQNSRRCFSFNRGRQTFKYSSGDGDKTHSISAGRRNRMGRLEVDYASYRRLNNDPSLSRDRPLFAHCNGDTLRNQGGDHAVLGTALYSGCTDEEAERWRGPCRRFAVFSFRLCSAAVAYTLLFNSTCSTQQYNCERQTTETRRVRGPRNSALVLHK